MVIAALAWNLKSWFAMMMHRKSDRRAYIKMEFRRFINGIILIPAMITRRARASPSAPTATPPPSTDCSPSGPPPNAPALVNPPTAHHQPRPSTRPRDPPRRFSPPDNETRAEARPERSSTTPARPDPDPQQHPNSAAEGRTTHRKRHPDKITPLEDTLGPDTPI